MENTSNYHYYCCVDGCSNKKKSSKLSFFKLPQDSERRNIWLKEIGRSELLNKTDLKHGSYRVCSIHFESSVMSEIVTRKILPGAVPTKFLPNKPQPSTSKCETEPCTNSEVSTQTKDSYINMLYVAKIRNASTNDINTQTIKTEKEQEAQTTQALSFGTPRKRELRSKLQTSEKKRRRQEHEFDKIKKETEAKNSL